MCIVRVSGLLLGLLLATLGMFSSTVTNPAIKPACPTDVIQFTQDTGCLNDGSVEFCIPADDPATLAAVQNIAPGTECHPWRGRAKCDTERELLCMVPTQGLCRADAPRAMTDAGWTKVCALAALPFVEEIVPTWYE